MAGQGANSVNALMKTMNKEYGVEVGTVGIRDDEPTRLPTGMFTFDLITGGGLPEGRVTVIYGHESAMKTTLCLKAIASAQRRYPDRTAAFVDVEGHLDRKWAKKMGVDVDKLAHIIPENGEQTIDIVEALLAADDISIVIVDSLAAMQVKAELEKSTDESVMGKSGLIIGRFYRKVTHALNVARINGGYCPTLVCINQIRMKMGTGPGQDPETMPGGMSFKFVSSLTVRLNGSDVVVKKVHPDLPAYRRISVIIKKNKVPIVAKKGELQVALRPIEEFNLQVGELYSWNTVLAYLKNTGLIAKNEGKEGGWAVIHSDTGEVEVFKTQDELKYKLAEDVKYADRVYANLINKVRESDGVIEAEK